MSSCCICLEPPMKLVTLHSRHWVCSDCYEQIERCPLCREDIEKPDINWKCIPEANISVLEKDLVVEDDGTRVLLLQ